MAKPAKEKEVKEVKSRPIIIKYLGDIVDIGYVNEEDGLKFDGDLFHYFKDAKLTMKAVVKTGQNVLVNVHYAFKREFNFYQDRAEYALSSSIMALADQALLKDKLETLTADERFQKKMDAYRKSEAPENTLDNYLNG